MIKVAAAVIRDGEKILVTRRKPGGQFGGLWEFPGGKVKAGEPPEAALAREILEELGLVVSVGKFLGVFRYRAPGGGIELLAYRAVVESGALRLTDHDGILWARPEDLDASGFSPADIPLLQALKKKAGR
jgi:mutator protein MutT